MYTFPDFEWRERERERERGALDLFLSLCSRFMSHSVGGMVMAA